MDEPVIELPPDILFRFRPDNTKHSFRDELLNAVNFHRIWCEPISMQNDPFDANLYFSKSPVKEITRYISDFSDVHGPDVNITGRNLRELVKKRGITDEAVLRHILAPKRLAELTAKAVVQSFFDL